VLKKFVNFTVRENFRTDKGFHFVALNREIIFEEFQPIWSQLILQRHEWTDGQTTCRSMTR